MHLSRVTSCLAFARPKFVSRPRCNQLPRGICLQTQLLLSSPLAVVVSFLICFGLIWVRFDEVSKVDALTCESEVSLMAMTLAKWLLSHDWWRLCEMGRFDNLTGEKFSTFVGSPYLRVLKSNAFYPSCWSLMFDVSLIVGYMLKLVILGCCSSVLIL